MARRTADARPVRWARHAQSTQPNQPDQPDQKASHARSVRWAPPVTQQDLWAKPLAQQVISQDYQTSPTRRAR
ncbi:hypothetical protein Kisp02_14170 [Kineosporia sp. NBRC 101731]|nr:hypothetical protein Kisp02_14170 [Kineosporia sp. NBRC 101731]